MYRIPTEIDYGTVQDIDYLSDYGRFEAQVVLHFAKGDAVRKPVKILASVAARPGEAFDDLRLRLVLKAARLLRVVEVSDPPTPEPANIAA